MVKIVAEIISIRYKSLGELINSKRLKHIVVISKSGEILGRIKEVRMKGFGVEGIIFYRPWSFGSTFIDKSFIKVFNQNEALLNINPVTSLKGLSVYDTAGRDIGKVRKVMRPDKRNDFTSLVVKNRFYSRSVLIPKDKIDIMKKNIVLNIDYLEYSDQLKKKKKADKEKGKE